MASRNTRQTGSKAQQVLSNLKASKSARTAAASALS